MMVITDHGEAKNIHPEDKEPFGLRLAPAARALAYGEKIEYCGPVFDKMRTDGNLFNKNGLPATPFRPDGK